MLDDATRQGDQNQDVMDGIDLDPVTAESSEQEGQTETTPKNPDAEKPTEGEESGAVKTNAEAKKQRIIEKKTKITQQEWQDTQEKIAKQDAELVQIRMEKEQAKFESRNPIVTSDRYAKKWEELCKAKADPENKYHRLDFSDLRKLLLDDEEAEVNEEAIEELQETERKRPVSPPKFGSSGSKPKAPGGVDPETYEHLKAMGYSDEQIAESDNISLPPRSR